MAIKFLITFHTDEATIDEIKEALQKKLLQLELADGDTLYVTTDIEHVAEDRSNCISQFRWVKRITTSGGGWAVDRKVLQYRTRTNPLEEGLHPPIWSGWKDVPEETACTES